MTFKSALTKIRLSILPRSLWWRSITIMIAPVIAIEIVVSIVFFDTHWQTVSRRMALNISDNIQTVLDLKNVMADDEAGFLRFMRTFNRNLGLEFVFLPPMPRPYIPLSTQTVWKTSELRPALKGLNIPFTVQPLDEQYAVRLRFYLPDSTLQVVIPYKRFFSSTVYVFALWTLLTSLVVLFIAAIFMKNQIRPIVRLAAAAECFGLGRTVTKFKPEGALEVRRAASSFIQMRDRIRRYIDERTRMLAGISHDLRTPLTRMRLQLAMMGDDESIVELLNDVEEMEQMVNGYLAFIKGQEGQPVAETDIGTLISELLSTYNRAGVSLQYIGAPNIVMSVRPNDFKRCLNNLLSNASRYASAITVTLQKKDRFVEILVEDNGPGIPKEKREDAFKAFYRLDESRNSETGGVGLGLSITRDIVLAHGGMIALDESALGGLKVVMRFPLQ